MDKRIVFMGSPDFAVPSLIKLAEEFNLVGVLTQPDRKGGRGRSLISNPIKVAASNFQVPILQSNNIRKDPDTLSHLEDLRPDLIVVAAFGQILRKNILELAEFGCVNVHASLLPRWRGASPINAAILHGDSETGITIMKMDSGIDTGNILAQKSIDINDLNAGQLSDKLAYLGANLLSKTLPEYFSGKLKPIKQNDENATYAPMLSKEDGRLDFNQSAKQLERKVKAYSPWPGTFTTIDEKPFKIHQVYSVDKDIGEIGEKIIYEKFPAIQTADGLLVLTIVQPAGKKAMDGKQFLRGSRDWI